MIRSIVASAAQRGFDIGLLITAFSFGFRHGIDWDHIAAITDITGSQEERRQAILFGTLYALGHALVVFGLGSVAIMAGKELPGGVDKVMTRVVGVTLLLLGVYVFVSLVRHGRDFRLRSRWMLIFSGVRKGARWARERVRAANGQWEGNGERDGAGELQPSGSEARTAVALAGRPGAPPAETWHHGHHGRPGHHHHDRPEADDAFMNYGRATAFFVGMIHGIGAETPTQLLIFVAASTQSAGVGLLVLGAFIIGLLSSNTLITLGSAFGFLQATKNFKIYATVAVLTGTFSLIIGTIFVLGKTTVLPAMFGG
jgi:sulfite exporter TauE/SafE